MALNLLKKLSGISPNGAAAIGSSWKEIYFLTDISDSRQFRDVAREASGRAELARTAAPFCKIASDSERFCRTFLDIRCFKKRSELKCGFSLCGYCVLYIV